MKRVQFGTEARKKVCIGIDTIADAVRVTLGPKGKNVILQRQQGTPIITNDGVSIARDIDLEDSMEQVGASLIKQVAEKTNDNAGDGTTTSIVLAQSIIKGGMKLIEAGMNPVSIRLGMEQAKNDAIKFLKESAKVVDMGDELEKVATISAENKELGKNVADAIREVGRNGIVMTDISHVVGISKETVKGTSFEAGYLSPYLVTNQANQKSEIKNPSILLYSGNLNNPQHLSNILEKLTRVDKRDVVIITKEIEAGVLGMLILNKVKGNLNVNVVKVPDEVNQDDFLGDIASLTGATIISEDVGTKLQNIELSALGEAERVESSRNETIIVGGKGNIEERVESIKGLLKNASTGYSKRDIEGRIANLVGGVCIIKIGASTETELTYIKHKLDDTIAATKAAVTDGIVPGGGTALVKVSTKMVSNDEDEEFTAGYKVVVNSLLSPLKQIVENTSNQSPDVVVDKVKESAQPFFGYNAKENVYEDDMFTAGIIDPMKVTCSALENAVSIAGLFLTTEAVVIDVVKD